MLGHFNNWFFTLFSVMHVGKKGVKSVEGKSNEWAEVVENTG